MRPLKTIAEICALLALSLFSGGCHHLFDDTPARFVAVGMLGDACWSVDGGSWACSTLAEDTQLNSVACSPDTCIAVDAYGSAYVSTDGKTWVSEIVSQDTNLISIAYGNGLFVAVSADKYAYYRDSTAWHASETPVAAFSRIAFGGGRFVATGVMSVQYTDAPDQPDSWKYVQFMDDLSTVWPFLGLAYTGDSFVFGYVYGAVYIAPDNFTQTSDLQKVPLDFTVQGPVLAFGEVNGTGTLIIAGSSKIARSTDGGHTWQDVSPDFSVGGISGIAFGDGQFMLSGFNRKLYRSTDGGQTWRQVAFYSRLPKDGLMSVAFRAGE